jgi:hypothetical protein
MLRGPTARIMCIGRCRAISPRPTRPSCAPISARRRRGAAWRRSGSLQVLGEPRLFSPHTDDRDDYRDLLPASDDGEMAVRQCRSNLGRGVPRTAIAPTTSSHNGSTPKPGIASRASPGNSSHCWPNTMNSSSAVPRSTTHTIGGKGVAKAPIASEMPAMAKARASCFLENLRAFRVGVAALFGCLLGSVGGSVIIRSPRRRARGASAG